MVISATMDDLKREVRELRRTHPKLLPDNAFVAWFLRAYLAVDDAGACVTGGPRDKGVDALHVDHGVPAVFVVQGKYRTTDSPAAEKRSDVIEFAEVAAALLEGGTKLSTLCSKANDAVARGAREASSKVIDEHYALRMHFVTTGRVSPGLQEEAKARIDSAEHGLIQFHGRREVLNLYRDYVQGVQPPVGSLELPIEGDKVLPRYDEESGIESWVFSMRAIDIAQRLGATGPRIFARNIRGFLGSTPVNRNIRHTLEQEPANFWYLNNGITLVCDNAETRSAKGLQTLYVENPQIINGQQTTRVLTEIPNELASVLVRVIAIPSDTGESHASYGHLTSQIVSATNWQNQIKASDLRANDPEQVRIERELRKVGYQYLRKREAKGEARRAAGKAYAFQVQRQELATAIAGCILDPGVLRRGKEVLFEDETYPQLFSPDRSFREYLTFYWLQVAARAKAWGDSRRGYARWLTLNFIWGEIGSFLSVEDHRRRFVYAMERRKTSDTDVLESLEPLLSAIGAVYDAAMAFYKSHPEGGKGHQDESTFFKHAGLHKQFRTFWPTYSALKRGKFTKRVSAFKTNLQSMLME